MKLKELCNKVKKFFGSAYSYLLENKLRSAVVGLCLVIGVSALAFGFLSKGVDSKEPATIVYAKDTVPEKEEVSDLGYFVYVSGIKDWIVEVGSSIDPMENINWDKDFILSVEVCDNNVDFTKPGTYSVTYKIVAVDKTIIYKSSVVWVVGNEEADSLAEEGKEVITNEGIKNEEKIPTVQEQVEESKSVESSTKNTGASEVKQEVQQEKPVENEVKDTVSKPEHQHSWVADIETIEHPEEYHIEKVVVKEAWVEEKPVYETVVHLICKDCEEDLKDLSEEERLEHLDAHKAEGGLGEVTEEEEEVQTGVEEIEHPEEVEEKKVVDKEAWVEEKIVGYHCSCGATK